MAQAVAHSKPKSRSPRVRPKAAQIKPATVKPDPVFAAIDKSVVANNKMREIGKGAHPSRDS
jgi:hypothetical protein